MTDSDEVARGSAGGCPAETTLRVVGGAGKVLEAVKELLGHSSILTTHIYSRALAANVRPFMETTEF